MCSSSLFGNHHHGQLGPALFDAAQGIDAGEAGHLLVEEDEVGLPLLQLVKGVAARLHGDDVVAFLF